MLTRQMTRRDVVAAGAVLGTVGALAAPRAAHAGELLSAISQALGVAGGAAGQADPAQAVSAPTASARPSLLAGMSQVEDVQGASASCDAPAADLSNVANVDWFYLNDLQRQLLATYGFFCDISGYNEFFEVYENNRYMALPNFVTVDSLLHSYHLYFSHLLKFTERDYLAGLLGSLSGLLVQTASEQLQALQGTEWQAAAQRNVAFFGIGACLQGLEVSVPEDIANTANQELQLIYDAQGIATSPLFGDMEDYSQYAPRGYYEGDSSLEGYFRAMMWYGRRNFRADDEDLCRSALLATIALQGAVLDSWQKIYVVTSFFVGASDDNGYYEYEPLIEAAYGGVPSASELAGNDGAWSAFCELVAQTPAPKINSIPTVDDPDTDTVQAGTGFRLMGQRFSIDEAIFQQLVYSRVGANSAGETRMLPDVLDVPAAFGSEVAYSLLQNMGATDFSGYADNMANLREGLQQADESLWQASLYAMWLRTLKPLCAQKGEGYPWFMRSEQWSRRCLQAFAGSYAELKHDTLLYAKQIIAEMGGGDTPERDDRGYVEPEPEVFGCLAALSRATSDGLALYGLIGEEDASNLAILSELASRLEAIARKELAGELPSDEEFDLIRTYGGQIEHFWYEVYKYESESEYFKTMEFPCAIVADIATDPNGSCLEVATGRASDMYVLAPIEGQLHLMSGSTYSFYQFTQPISERMTDTVWRQVMGIELNDEGRHSTPSMDPIWWTQDYSYNSRA